MKFKPKIYIKNATSPFLTSQLVEETNYPLLGQGLED